MDNFRVLIFFLLLFCWLGAAAQKGIKLMPLEMDSSQIELERQFEYRQLITGQIPDGFMVHRLEFPKFDFKNNFKNDFTLSFNRYFAPGINDFGFSLGPTIPYFSTYYGNTTILSQGAYRLNDKFVFGGYSYGTNSPFSAPLPSNFEPFNRYGSTFFMQYKVGKNFKIETRVNVSQGGHPGF
jgi:hypothetical protein